MSVDSTDELDAILDKHRICPNGRPDNTCEPCKRADVEAKAALQSLIEDARVDELNKLKVQFIRSHWERLCGERNSWAKYVDRRIAQLSNSKEGK